MKVEALNKIKGLILDMDGVLWRESVAIGNLGAIFSKIKDLGLKYVLATNNSTRTPQQFVEKLSSFGVEIPVQNIVTSGMGVAYLLSKKYPNGGPVYIVGDFGLVKALEDFGFYQADQNPLVVIASIDHQINFEKLKSATLFIRSGIPFYGTNPDRTYPTPKGLIPGSGAIIGAIEIATDVSPIMAGKPNPTLYEFSLEKLGTLVSETLIVGDRLETDILGGQRLGCPTALVLSGISTLEQAENHNPPVDFIVRDLSELISLFDER